MLFGKSKKSSISIIYVTSYKRVYAPLQLTFDPDYACICDAKFVIQTGSVSILAPDNCIELLGASLLRNIPPSRSWRPDELHAHEFAFGRACIQVRFSRVPTETYIGLGVIP